MGNYRIFAYSIGHYQFARAWHTGRVSQPTSRKDAQHNRARLVAAAREAFGRADTEPSLEEIAALAGVGIATLYRHFPRRDDLVAAVFQQIVDDELAPLLTVEPATSPVDALRLVLERMLALIATEQGLLIAAGNSAAVTEQVVETIRPQLGALLERAQAARQVRRDLSQDDLVPLVVMFISTVAGAEAGSNNWARYLALVFDALTTPSPTRLPHPTGRAGTLLTNSPLLRGQPEKP